MLIYQLHRPRQCADDCSGSLSASADMTALQFLKRNVVAKARERNQTAIAAATRIDRSKVIAFVPVSSAQTPFAHQH